MKTMIFSYAGPISGLQKALDGYIELLEQPYEYDMQDIGDCDILGYCTGQCRYYGSCETF